MTVMKHPMVKSDPKSHIKFGNAMPKRYSSPKTNFKYGIVQLTMHRFNSSIMLGKPGVNEMYSTSYKSQFSEPRRSWVV